ncbi:hypothetical protein [Pedobacter cryoconitis]|uniref:Uncharacterized protein n=1 Tax=Pedobacter cryoconitis TaxID=188932 RepID=A0A327RW83_9SPHI|nr:hypothetical protein [Pedobacter cryoconitis]RAJ20725.1 hypothetical protein LY11_05146 [Pedobacter cryoconitis]
MKKDKQHEKPKVADSEDFNTNKPQEQTLPRYNSTSEHRDGSELPAIENLNQQEGIKDQLKDAKNNDSDNNMTQNSDPLYGKNTKTNLGAGQRDEDEDEKEKIIRT